MILTPIYKFKKRELTDSPPDITANNSNWDVLETNLKSHADSIASQGKQIDVLNDKVIWKEINWKTESALPSDYPNQSTTIFFTNANNNFYGSGNKIVRTIKFDNNTGIQYLEGQYTKGILPIVYRQCLDGGTWGKWLEIATGDEIGNLLYVLGDIKTGDNLDNYKKFSRYSIWNGVTNCPCDWADLMVRPKWDDGGSTGEQILISNNGDRLLTRGWNNSNNPVFTKWTEYATTDKINISCTPKAGYTIADQHNYRINNIVYYNLIVEKIDGTSFDKNTTLDLCTMPSGNTPPFANGVVGSFRGLVSGLGMGTGTVTFLQDGSIYVVTNSDNVSQIRISGTVVL